MRYLRPPRQWVIVACLLAIGLGACATAAPVAAPRDDGSDPATVSRSPQATEEPRSLDLDQPPPVTVTYGTDSVDLDAYGYCFGNICADGSPPPDPPSVGSPAEVTIDFPLADWTFQATFVPAGQRCGRMQTIALQRAEDGSILLRPAGHAGTYDVTLFGRGHGDLVTVFRWTTPTDGPLPEPESGLALLSGGSARTDSYGVELELSNLASTPAKTAATITVTAANGESLTVEAHRSMRCQPEGSVYFDGPDAQGAAAAQLGPPPFTYRVGVTLDGEGYTATARWPADEIRGNEPSVPLRFSPALPQLQ